MLFITDTAKRIRTSSAVLAAILFILSFQAFFFPAVTSAFADRKATALLDVLLTSFEKPTEQQSWTNGKIASIHVTEGKNSLQIMPGTTAAWQLEGDWSGYRHLKLDVYNPGSVINVGFRFVDSSGQWSWAFEYNIYSGRTTQHIRIDGLANDFGIGEGIDVTEIVRAEVHVNKRWQHDNQTDGIYIDNLRLSKNPTEPFKETDDGSPATDPMMPKPQGFLLPEFPGFEAGYNTFAIDPAGYQLLTRPGTGRDGKGRALEFKPLSVDKIRIWDNARNFPKTGTYVIEFWAKGPSGSRFVDHSGEKNFDLSTQWTKYFYEFRMAAGQTRRFVLEAQNLQGKSVWLDDFVVYLKNGRGSLEPVSKAKGSPSIVTYADGICYINGKPEFMLGFLRSDPEVLKGTPFNFCAPPELVQPDIQTMDKCAEYGLWTSVNLTAPLRAVAPDNAVYFAEKYKNHPALFTYYLCDEPDHASPSATSEAPVIARATQMLRQADPTHPSHALVIPWCASNIYRYRDTVDILSADRYAVRGTKNNNELWTVYRANMAVKISATEGQVNIFTPMAGRNITREENWAQAYMCVAAGAGGIMWFPFGGARAKWDDFLELGKELRSIEEFLVGVALERGLTFQNDVLSEFTTGSTVLKDFKQIRGIGRAGKDKTALITVNLTPHPAENVKITAPFLAQADSAVVMFEERTVPVKNGLIVDSYAGLERHVYIVEGLPKGVKQRPVPKVGGSHVTDAGAAWRLRTAGMARGRSAEQLERDKFMQVELKKADDLLQKGDKEGALRVLRAVLERYPDAQDVRERIRVIR
jgi:hypothetical protein